MMKRIENKALLFDFYGPLLTAKQSKVWDLYYQQDFSLAEIAEEEGISRQAVHDLLKRTEKILKGYEQKLKLIARFRKDKERVKIIGASLAEINREDFANQAAWERHLEISGRIKEIIAEVLEDNSEHFQDN
jgi:predicted DNA-binding protein YlxM (UPF0122 family)